jgi:hypothetical protein
LISLTGHAVTLFSSNSPGKMLSASSGKRSGFTDKLRKSWTTGPGREINGLALDRDVTGRYRV